VADHSPRFSAAAACINTLAPSHKLTGPFCVEDLHLAARPTRRSGAGFPPFSPSPSDTAEQFFQSSGNASPLSRVADSWRALVRVRPMMRKEFECRRNGILSLELAHRAADSADEARMLKLAQDWLDLANLIHRQSGQRVRKIGEHPLVRAKLGAHRAA
jgi:hypothetical protein